PLVDVHASGNAVLALAARGGHLLKLAELQRGHERERPTAALGHRLEDPRVALDPQQPRRVDEPLALAHEHGPARRCRRGARAGGRRGRLGVRADRPAGKQGDDNDTERARRSHGPLTVGVRKGPRADFLPNRLRSTPVMVRDARIPLALLLVCLAAFLAACRSSFDRHRAGLRAQIASGRWDDAARSLDTPSTRKLYGDRNELLWLLDRGSIAQAMGDAVTAVDTLNRAEDIMDRVRGESVGDVLAALLINDTLRRYTGEPYEDIYINVLKMLAHLDSGWIEGGATVEARRIATKANMLRDRWLEVYPATRRKAEDTLGDADLPDAPPPSDSETPSV